MISLVIFYFGLIKFDLNFNFSKILLVFVLLNSRGKLKYWILLKLTEYIILFALIPDLFSFN